MTLMGVATLRLKTTGLSQDPGHKHMDSMSTQALISIQTSLCSFQNWQV